MKTPLAELHKPFFWLLLIVFLVGVFLHYTQYLPAPVSGIGSFLGSTRDSTVRILFLVVIILGGLLSGLTVGFVYLIFSGGSDVTYFIFVPRFRDK